MTGSPRGLCEVAAFAGTMLTVLVNGGAFAEPAPVTLEVLHESDAAALPAYTLRVTIEQPVQTVFRRQGIARYACVLTRGEPGLAAVCEAEQLPDPVYCAPGSPGYYEPEYDSEGNLFLDMPSRWVTLWTATTNETYEEGQGVLVNPEGAVVRALGLRRTLSRYAPDDRWGLALCRFREVWWALGQGLSGDFERIVGTSEAEGVERVEIGGKLEGRWTGVWRIALETQGAAVIRKASFTPAARSEPTVEVASKGARMFGSVTLAEEGVVRFPHRHDPFETRVVLKDFQPRFDEKAFAEVQQTLERVRADDSIKVLDHPRPSAATERPGEEKTEPSDDR